VLTALEEHRPRGGAEDGPCSLVAVGADRVAELGRCEPALVDMHHQRMDERALRRSEDGHRREPFFEGVRVGLGERARFVDPPDRPFGTTGEFAIGRRGPWEQRCPGGQFERRVEDEGVRGIAARDRHDPGDGGDQARIGQ
jgi:hypothetical protein